MNTSAKIIADSIGPNGVRLVTMEIVLHRFVLSEFNTARAFSRNSASSRAIPVEKMLSRFRDNPAWPLEWDAEQKGMQGGDELTGDDLADAQWLFNEVHDGTVEKITDYLEKHPEKSTRLHKSLVNRLTEWGQYHTIVCTSTAWENFFEQRCSPLAQPEIRVAAEQMRAAFLESEPRTVPMDDWHLPYIQEEDWAALSKRTELGHSMYPEAVKISAARCARVSYLTQDGKRDLDADIALYERLTTARPAHWSPLEHVATPWPLNHLHIGLPFQALDGYTHSSQADVPYIGNLLGWRSLRTEVEAQLGAETFR